MKFEQVFFDFDADISISAPEDESTEETSGRGRPNREPSQEDEAEVTRMRRQSRSQFMTRRLQQRRLRAIIAARWGTRACCSSMRLTDSHDARKGGWRQFALGGRRCECMPTRIT